MLKRHNPTNRASLTQKVSRVINLAVKDIEMMCKFNESGQSLYQLFKQKSNEAEEKQCEQHNDYYTFIQMNADQLKNYFNISKEQLLQQTMRIWGAMDTNQREYFNNLYSDANFVQQSGQLAQNLKLQE